MNFFFSQLKTAYVGIQPMSPKHWKMALASPVKILNQSPLMLEPSPISTPKPENDRLLLPNLQNKNEKVRSAKKVISFDSIEDPEPKENIQTGNDGASGVENNGKNNFKNFVKLQHGIYSDGFGYPKSGGKPPTFLVPESNPRNGTRTRLLLPKPINSDVVGKPKSPKTRRKPDFFVTRTRLLLPEPITNMELIF